MTARTPDIFSIEPGSAAPRHRQIVQQTRMMIDSGKLKSGDRMPSAHSVGDALAVHPTSVLMAYQVLANEGILSRRAGLGIVVVKRCPAKVPTPRIEVTFSEYGCPKSWR